MDNYKLQDMVRGWFVGDFKPTVLPTKEFEVAVQEYKKGDCEEEHYHKIATEITVIVGGEAEMAGNVYKDGDIVVIAPGEVTGFKALTDVKTVVVKCPSVMGDKYITGNK